MTNSFILDTPGLIEEQNMYKERIISFLVIGLMCLTLAQGCKNKSEESSFVYADKYFAPKTGQTIAILLYTWQKDQKRDFNTPVVLIGDMEEARNITSRPLEPKKLIEGREWLDKIMDAYEAALKDANEKEFHGNGISDGYIYFITQDIVPKKGYMRSVGIDKDENTVCDQYMKSDLLKKYFDELGLTDDLLAGKPEFDFVSAARYDLPPTDKIVSILLYPPHSDSSYTPLALFGDKDLTEKLIGHPIEPNHFIEGRDWLQKIIDAYNTALKEAESIKFHIDPNNYKHPSGQIIFVTTNHGYMKIIDIGENIVYNRYMESTLLKEYFDELGLTKELLAK